MMVLGSASQYNLFSVHGYVKFSRRVEILVAVEPSNVCQLNGENITQLDRFR